MSNLHFIILMVVLGLYVLGSLIQAFILAKGLKFREWLLIFFYSFIVQIFVSPFTWVTYSVSQEKKTYSCTLLTHTAAKHAALVGLGFVYSEHRVSRDNLPYRGYSCWIDSTHLIIALDDEFQSDRKPCMRLSVLGRHTDVVKYMINRVKDIDVTLEESNTVN